METTLAQRLEQLLIDFRYESSMGLGKRCLQDHHINALKKDLIPFIEEEKQRAFKEGQWDISSKF